jgi:DNA-binding PadR family transcriptional regulator
MSTIHAVLGLLIERDCHGYEIATRLAERVGVGPYNSGQIHQALEIIERRGWATGGADTLPNRARRQFTVTPAGRTEFMAWLDRPIPAGRTQRDDVVLKMIFLAEHDVPRLVQLLRERKREYVLRLAAHHRQPNPNGSLRDVAKRLIRDKFALQDQCEVEWTEHCLRALEAAGQATSCEGVTPSLADDGEAAQRLEAAASIDER